MKMRGCEDGMKLHMLSYFLKKGFEDARIRGWK